MRMPFMMAIWFALLFLATVWVGVARLPGWWRETRRSNLPDRRQRVFAPGLTAIAFLMLFGVTAGLVDRHGRPHWLAWTSLGLLIVAVVLLLLLPLVAYLHAFDFLVPPWLRRGAPPRPEPTVVFAEAGPGKKKRGKKEPPKPADGHSFLRITRPANAWRDFTRKFMVEVDGDEVGRLRRGGFVQLELPAGIHTVRGVFGEASSPVLRVPLGSGDTVRVKLLPSVGEKTGTLLIRIADPPVRRPTRQRSGRKVSR